MTKLFAILVVALTALTACGGSKSKDSTSPRGSSGESPVGGPGEPAIDPTLPSWAPASCTSYQKAVFQAINCDAIDKGKRDAIQTKYNASSESWKAEGEADAARIEQVHVACHADTESVRAEIGDACTPEVK